MEANLRGNGEGATMPTIAGMGSQWIERFEPSVQEGMAVARADSGLLFGVPDAGFQ